MPQRRPIARFSLYAEVKAARQRMANSRRPGRHCGNAWLFEAGADLRVGTVEEGLELAQPWFGVPPSAQRRPRAAGGWYKSELTRGTRHLRGLASESPRGFPLEREAIGGLRSHLY